MSNFNAPNLISTGGPASQTTLVELTALPNPHSSYLREPTSQKKGVGERVGFNIPPDT